MKGNHFVLINVCLAHKSAEEVPIMEHLGVHSQPVPRRTLLASTATVNATSGTASTAAAPPSNAEPAALRYRHVCGDA